MLLESACIPIPSEAIMPFAGFAVSQGHMSLLGIVVAGVAGNLLRLVRSAYGVGYYGGRPFVERYGRYVLLRMHHLVLAERFFARYGPITVFFARMVPIVCTFISLPAGFGRMPFWKFTLYTVAGPTIWVMLLGFVGEKLGSNWEKIAAAAPLPRLRRRRGPRRAGRVGDRAAPPGRGGRPGRRRPTAGGA